MNDVMRQERPTPIDLFQWLDSEFPTFRSSSNVEHMRVEDFIEDDHYVLRAERREETKSERRSVFHYGSFARRVALPAGADEDDVSATYDKGLLEVRVGIKAESAPEPRHITVTRS